jgi:hypothetical protein
LGKSEGREDEVRTETGALSEDAGVDVGSAADSALGDRLPPLPGQPKSAGDLSLDLAAALDEPEQLVRCLVIAAQEHVGYSENSDKWKVVLGHATAAAKELEKLNAPASHRGVKVSSS